MSKGKGAPIVLPRGGSTDLPQPPKDEPPRICDTCRFHWAKENPEYGDCRRFPPDKPSLDRSMSGGPTVYSYRITLASLPACGEYQKR